MSRRIALFAALVFAWAFVLIAVSDAGRAGVPVAAAASAAPSRVEQANQTTAAGAAAARVDFAAQIRPILETNCFECHGGDQRKGGLSLA